MPQSPIVLKGSNFTLSVIHLHSEKFDDIYQALSEKVKQAPAFLNNAPIVLNVEDLPIDVDLHALQRVVEATGLHVVGISGCKNDQQKQQVTEAGLPLLTEGKEGKKQPPRSVPPLNNKSIIISKPIRTGQQIYARNADLIVTTDVSAGAELIADGNIHIYGMMRGRALAGAEGDDQSHIFCTQLAAELVSIAGQYWLSEQIPSEYYEKAAQLSIKDNILTIKYLK